MSVEELQKIASKYEGRITKLFLLGRRGLTKSEKISYVKEFGFTEEDVSQLLKLARDMDIYEYDYSDMNDDEGLEFFGVIHAWFALSELKVSEFKGILLEMVEDGDENDYDDWVLENFVDLIAPYRKDMYEYFAKGVISEKKSTWTRLCYVETIKEMLKANEVSLEIVEKLIVEVLKYGENDIVNAFMIGICVDYKLTKYYELIKECFKRQAVDLNYLGDLEDVEIELGLREKRETEKEPNIFQKMLLGCFC